MISVEKEGMKLYDNLGKISGGESGRLQELLEDFCKHGTYIPVQSLRTLTLGHYLKVFEVKTHILKCFTKIISQKNCL